jgi:hypothetical protein
MCVITLTYGPLPEKALALAAGIRLPSSPSLVNPESSHPILLPEDKLDCANAWLENEELGNRQRMPKVIKKPIKVNFLLSILINSRLTQDKWHIHYKLFFMRGH